jgi:hypothetical protein
MRLLRAESEAGDGGILVSCKALRMGMGASHRLARLARRRLSLRGQAEDAYLYLNVRSPLPAALVR